MDRKVWSELVHLSQAPLCLFRLPRGTIGRCQIYIGVQGRVQIDRAPALLDRFCILMQVQVCMAEPKTPLESKRISGTETESQLNRRKGLARAPGDDECICFASVDSWIIWINFERSIVFSQCLL